MRGAPAVLLALPLFLASCGPDSDQEQRGSEIPVPRESSDLSMFTPPPLPEPPPPPVELPPARLELAETLDFGRVRVESGGALTLPLLNAGGSPLRITAVRVSGSADLEAERGCELMELRPGEACSVALSWRPSVADRLSASLLVMTEDAGLAEVALRGEAWEPVPPPTVEAPPSPPPPEPEPEPVVVERDPWRDDLSARVAALRRERASATPQLQQVSLPAPGGRAGVVDPDWRLEDEDYARLGLSPDESGLPVERHRIITADRYITAILENSINSQIPGRFIAITERHIFGSDGRIPLLPKGTRIICWYDSLAKVGETRLPGGCTRAVLPNGASVMLSESIPADQVGRTGLIGEVDNRTWERYGSAVIISVVSALAGAGAAVGGGPVVAEAGAGLSTNLGQVTAATLDQTIDLAPIVTVPMGSRIQIIPTEDIFIMRPERLREPRQATR